MQLNLKQTIHCYPQPFPALHHHLKKIVTFPLSAFDKLPPPPPLLLPFLFSDAIISVFTPFGVFIIVTFTIFAFDTEEVTVDVDDPDAATVTGNESVAVVVVVATVFVIKTDVVVVFANVVDGVIVAAAPSTTDSDSVVVVTVGSFAKLSLLLFSSLLAI